MKKHLMIFLILLFMCIPITHVHALTIDSNNNGSNDSSIIKTYDYKFSSDTTLTGVFAADTFPFDVTKDWSPSSCYLNLVFTQSPLLNKNQDTITVLLNNNAIYSENISKKLGYKENIKVAIPIDSLASGSNEIKIKTYKTITNSPCADDVNPSNWITIHKESFVHLDFTDKTNSSTLKNYPYPFMKPVDVTPTNSIILLPDGASSAETTGAMLITANFGKRRDFDNVNINIYQNSSSQIKKDTDIIYIGSKNDTPPELLSMLSAAELKSADTNAIIKYGPSPYNKDKKLLLILSNNTQNLVKACKLLSNSNQMPQFDVNTITVDNKLNVSDIKAPTKDLYSFLDMGYGDTTLQGLFKQQSTFNVSIPNNKLIEDTAKIAIKMKYSQNLDFNRSLMSVYINGIPVGSVKLSAAKANDDSVELRLPSEVRNMSNYNITVSFDLEEKDVTCKLSQGSSPWAFISNQSYIYLPSKASKDYSLENYPSPFISNGSFNNTLIVIPDKPSIKELNYLANILAFEGHSLKLNTGNFNVIKTSLFDKSKYTGNIIVFGLPQDNKLIKDLNNSLNIKFNSSYTAFLSNSKMNLSDGYSSNLASLDMFTSPYNNKSTIMVITAIKEEDLALATNYLTDYDLIKSLTGDGLVIDGDGNIKHGYYNIKDPTIIDTTPGNTSAISSTTKSLFVFISFIIIFLIVILTLFIKNYRRKK